MESEVKIPWGVRLFRFIARPFFRVLFRILCHVQIEGFENLPRKGGYLVSANHVSIYDPPFLVAFWPKMVEAAGAVDVLERGMQGLLMRLYGGMSVHRGQADRKLLMEMVRRLKAGLPVLMDPEGQRSYVPGMQEAHPGVAYVAARSGVPVVPVGVTGTDTVLAKWKRASRPYIRMVVGEPVHLPPVKLSSPDQKRDLRANTEIIMRAIANLLPPEYRGVYG